jgi:DNA polymerase III subunit gamma/tau
VSSTAPPVPAAPHQAIYRRWRAQTFGQMVGQAAVVETLRNAVRQDRVSHAILFVGPRGTGKTSLARIVAKALNCTNLQDGDPCDACPSCTAIREGRAFDLVEIDAASNRGIDAIRDLRERIHYAPTDLRRKVYILDEAHQITKDAWNALLKSLEEPPDFVVFMFASTHPQEFPPAILSRLQRYDVRRLSVAEIEGKLTRILEADGRAAEPGAVHLIARLAAGGMRDAESMLDQLLASAGDRLDEARVRDLLGLADGEAVTGFVNALLSGDGIAGIRILDALEDRGRDHRVFLDQVVDEVRSALVEALAQPETSRADPARIAAVGRALAGIDPNRAGTGGLRLQLELALLADVGAPPSVGPRVAAPGRTQPVPAAPPRPTPPAAADPVGRSTSATPAADPARSSTSATAAVATPAADPRASGAEPGPEPAPSDPPPTARRPAARPAAPPSAASAEPPGEGAAPKPGPSPAAPAAAEGGELDRLLTGWTQIIASVRPATRALITECRPLSVDGNIVTLGFPEAKSFLKDVAERKGPDLEAAVGAYLGRSVGVRCVATNLDVLPPLPADADAAFVLAEAKRIFADDLADVGEVS